jgi:hypothetical protein
MYLKRQVPMACLSAAGAGRDSARVPQTNQWIRHSDISDTSLLTRVGRDGVSVAPCLIAASLMPVPPACVPSSATQAW